MSEYRTCPLHDISVDVDYGECPECEEANTRRILEAAWDRLGRAEDPLEEGYYIVNWIHAIRWEALREAMFKGFDEDGE